LSQRYALLNNGSNHNEVASLLTNYQANLQGSYKEELGIFLADLKKKYYHQKALNISLVEVLKEYE
jgi:hypothetical protein